MSSIDDMAAKLFSDAVSAGRDDIVQALAYLIPIDQLMVTLSKDINMFNETWEKSLTRKTYSVPEIGSMCSGGVLKSNSYSEFIYNLAKTLPEDDVRFRFIDEALSQSEYELAERMVDSLSNTEGVIDFISERRERLIKRKICPFYLIGEPGKFTRQTARLFGKLDIDLPGKFSIENYTSTIWGAGRFEMAVDYVSDVAKSYGLGVPEAKLVDGEITIINSAIVKAFTDERKRIAIKNLGEWNEVNFPTHYPAITSAHVAEKLRSVGGISISPQFGEKSWNEKYATTNFVLKHNFISKDEGAMHEDDISLSMSLLSYEDCTKIRSKEFSKTVVLIPYDAELVLDDSNVPEELNLAMRYHRPEILKSNEGRLFNKLEKRKLSTKAYLRGFTSRCHVNLEPLDEIAHSPKFYEAMNSDIEVEYIKNAMNEVKKRAGNSVGILYFMQDNKLSIQDNVSYILGLYDKVVSDHDLIPAVSIHGSEELMIKLSEARSSIGYNPLISFEGSARNGYTEKQLRIKYRLGSMGHDHSMLDLLPQELLIKGARSSRKDDIIQICGLLDRLPITELAELAKTPAQMKFVISHFELEPHIKELPRRFQTAMSGKMLEDGLGL